MEDKCPFLRIIPSDNKGGRMTLCNENGHVCNYRIYSKHKECNRYKKKTLNNKLKKLNMA